MEPPGQPRRIDMILSPPDTLRIRVGGGKLQGLRGGRTLSGRQVADPGPRAQVGLRHADAQLVHLAVELLGREAKGILMMQLVGDAREG